MATKTTSKSKSAPAAKENAAFKVPKENFYGTGKRKSSIAKVWLFQGKGVLKVNDKELLNHFGSEMLIKKIIKPLVKLGLTDRYNAKISVLGGGLVGQADACILGISRALLKVNSEFRKTLKEEGFLSRDPRVKERKKYGRKKARKGYQFRKR